MRRTEMTSEFTDLVAIITGGASGIGAEVARQHWDLFGGRD